MSPTLSGSSALSHVKLSDALKTRDGIIFDFYPAGRDCHTVILQMLIKWLLKKGMIRRLHNQLINQALNFRCSEDLFGSLAIYNNMTEITQ